MQRDIWKSILDEVFGSDEEDAKLSFMSIEEQAKKRKFQTLGIWMEFSNVMFKDFKRLKISISYDEMEDE